MSRTDTYVGDHVTVSRVQASRPDPTSAPYVLLGLRPVTTESGECGRGSTHTIESPSVTT